MKVCASQNTIVTNFVVVSSVGIKRVDCSTCIVSDKLSSKQCRCSQLPHFAASDLNLQCLLKPVCPKGYHGTLIIGTDVPQQTS